MKTFLGVAFTLGSALASYNGMLDSATILIVIGCFGFIMAELEDIKDKIK